MGDFKGPLLVAFADLGLLNALLIHGIDSAVAVNFPQYFLDGHIAEAQRAALSS